MLELYLESPNKLILKEANPLPAPGDGQVKIRVIYGGICGSDLRVYRGTISYAAYPLRPGHEVLGTVTETGAGVILKTGTKVVVFPNTFCGECEFCLSGKTNICPSKKPLGVSIDGVFAQEIIVPAKYVVPVPANLADERAVLIEPFAVTVHALKKAEIGPGKSVAVVGCGTEGLLAVSLAVMYGAKVTAVDINPTKLEIAKKLGDVQTLSPDKISDQTFDVVVEAAGVTAAIEQSLQMVKPGGAMITLGITGDPATFIPIHVVRNELSIYGTIIYTMDDFAEATRLLQDPTFTVEPIISQFVRLTEYQQAFDDAISGNFAKMVLNFA
jgi:L-iditol 2-dehydrogenase